MGVISGGTLAKPALPWNKNMSLYSTMLCTFKFFNNLPTYVTFPTSPTKPEFHGLHTRVLRINAKVLRVN